MRDRVADVQSEQPIILRDVPSIRAWRAERPGSVGFVPTMGALHDGHATLIEQAKAENERVVVSVFVNPLQFDQASDLDRYPRDLDSDVALCRGLGVDAVFAPGVGDLYPHEPVVTLSAGSLGTTLEGASRPGHFDGMLTVVSKLLNLAQPDRVYFGRKDAQQLVIVRMMVEDLNLPVDVRAVPTVRDVDGVALSSRNRRLTAAQREAATAIPLALDAASASAASGASASNVRAAALARLTTSSLVVDDVELVSPTSLEPVPDDHVGEALLVIAVFAGEIRLIDNAVVGLGAVRPA